MIAALSNEKSLFKHYKLKCPLFTYHLLPFGFATFCICNLYICKHYIHFEMYVCFFVSLSDV